MVAAGQRPRRRPFRYNGTVDKAGHPGARPADRATVSASRFAQLTGVSRERLRTWERRHGFPAPARAGAGPRRYALDDVVAVVAVRRAAEQGVPIPRAIAAASRATDHQPLAPETFRAAADHAPVPMAMVSGPRPLRVVYVNGALLSRPGAPRVGDDLHVAIAGLAGSELERELDALFTTERSVAWCDHPSWSGDGEPVHSRLHRLPIEPGARPLVVVVGVGPPDVADLAAAHRRLSRRAERQARWLDTVGALADRFQGDAGDALLGGVADTLVEGLDAVDAAVALYLGGELATAPSSRGMLGARTVTVAAYADLGRALREGAPRWLAPATAAAFGVDADLYAVIVPVIVVGETLGALLLAFSRPTELTAEVGRLLTAVSASVGFAVLRDRLVQRAAAL